MKFNKGFAIKWNLKFDYETQIKLYLKPFWIEC